MKASTVFLILFWWTPPFQDQWKNVYSESAWADRDRWQNADELIRHGKLRSGNQVADIGCHEGYLSVKLATATGNRGKVFAVDVHKDLLEHLETEILKEKRKQDKANIENSEGNVVDEILYQNIVPVWGDVEELDGTRIRDDTMDCVLISNTFYLLKTKLTKH